MLQWSADSLFTRVTSLLQQKRGRTLARTDVRPHGYPPARTNARMNFGLLPPAKMQHRTIVLCCPMRLLSYAASYARRHQRVACVLYCGLNSLCHRIYRDVRELRKCINFIVF